MRYTFIFSIFLLCIGCAVKFNRTEVTEKGMQLKVGKWIETDSTGFVFCRYNAKGIKVGKAIHYDRNGLLHKVTPYKNGKKDGIEKHYIDSFVCAEYTYKNDSLIKSRMYTPRFE